MKRPVGLSDDQLTAIMALARSVSPQYRGFLLNAVLIELPKAGDINKAISAALAHLERAELTP
jgi:hypothetical protein